VHAVIETPTFRKAATAAGLTDDEVFAIIRTVAGDPFAGDLIPGTGGARKIRVAGRGKGKSGGFRVVTFYAADDVPVFLLDIYAKGERVDLSQAERNALRGILSQLGEAWRASAERVAARRWRRGR
jgi:hypothetical protein